MSRAVVILNTPAARVTVKGWVDKAPYGTRVEFKAPKRTLPQNDRMWAMLTDIAAQTDHMGIKYGTNVWKVIFMDALGKETDFVPALDGQSVVPIGQSSSDLSVDEMGNMIEIMNVYGVAHGVIFGDQQPPPAGNERE